MTEKKWYVLNTFSNKEKQVKETIEKLLKERSDLEEFFGRIHISSHKTFIIRDGKKITREKKVFPGYILIEMVMNFETYRFIKNIPAAMKFLGSKDKPKPLSESEINKILGVKEDGDEAEAEMNYIVGDRIQVVDGPFKGFEGSIEKINNEKQKLVVKVTVFGRITPVEVGFNQVERLD